MNPRGSCRVEVIATGDEIMYGRIIDTNSNWIARKVTELGGTLRRVTMIGDEPELISSTLQEALDRDAHFVIFTGGLGPSEDDLTVDSIGATLGKKPVIDDPTAATIKDVYTKRGITSPADHARGERMARILEGSDPMRNRVGFSVGMKISHKGKTIFTLPGVPSEMKGMFEEHIAPLIEEKATSKLLARTLKVSMVWKEFFPLYRELQEAYPEIYIKNAATPPMEGENRDNVHTIKVDIVVEAPTLEAAAGKMDAFLAEYQRRINALSGGEIRSGDNDKRQPTPDCV
jgi:molybdenum cofactor synthesis domain-containing protein